MKGVSYIWLISTKCLGCVFQATNIIINWLLSHLLLYTILWPSPYLLRICWADLTDGGWLNCTCHLTVNCMVIPVRWYKCPALDQLSESQVLGHLSLWSWHHSTHPWSPIIHYPLSLSSVIPHPHYPFPISHCPLSILRAEAHSGGGAAIVTISLEPKNELFGWRNIYTH